MPAAPKPYPQRIRDDPARYVGSTGRYGVYRLTDHLLRTFLWGDDLAAEAHAPLDVKVHTDGKLEVERRWSGREKLWPCLHGLPGSGDGAPLMARHFNRCIRSSQAGVTPLQWERGNPHNAVFLAYGVALSTEARVEISSAGRTLAQSYRDGQPCGPVEVLEPQDTGLRLELKLDRSLLSEEIPAYPFRIRLRELAALLPGLRISLHYKGFKAVEYLFEQGVADLLRGMISSEERIHRDPFRFDFAEGGLRYRCALLLTESEMERVKSFATLDESHHGGAHERVLRQVVRDVVRQVRGRALRQRRQSWENVATSRTTYYGQFAVSVPFHRDLRHTGYVSTIPGLAAAVWVLAPDLEWQSPLRSEVVGPDLGRSVRPALHRAFEEWACTHAEALDRWLGWLEGPPGGRGRRRS